MFHNRFFSWEGLIIGYVLVMFVLVLLAGCSTTVATTVGDTTYSSSFSLRTYEVNRDE